jgi:transcriptional regulator with XRE-family HTH domain
MGNEEIGNRVRELRLIKGWSQKRLAEEMGFKSSQIISSIEKGERGLKFSELASISSILLPSASIVAFMEGIKRECIL